MLWAMGGPGLKNLNRAISSPSPLAAEMSTDQHWIGPHQVWSQFWPDQAWSPCNFFENWWTRRGPDWKNFLFL